MRTNWIAAGVVAALVGVAGWIWWPAVNPSKVAPGSSGASSDQLVSPTDRIGAPVRESSDALTQLLAGTGGGASLSAAERRRHVQRLFDVVRAINPLVPRETFDIEAVAAQVGRDPIKLHQWVHERTTWVPYRGSLRGAAGTLMDRVGNSLDRSLLLANLLRGSGVPARLARARLSADAARSLQVTFQTAADPQAQAEPAGFSEAVGSAIDAHATAAGLDPAQIRRLLQQSGAEAWQAGEKVKERVSTQTAMLVKSLGLPSDSASDSTAADFDALRDHWWVQARRGDAWTDFDPALGQPAAAVAPAQETLDLEAIPADLHHSVRVRVVVEKWNGVTFEELQPVSIDLRPSEVLGESLRLQHIPMTWPRNPAPAADSQRWFADTAVAQHEWLPVFTIGARRIAQSSVMETGDLNRQPGTKPASIPAGGIADAFGGGSDPAPGMFTAEWIEYEIHAPGSSPQIVRREVFDLVGGAGRAGRRVPSSLTDALRLTRALSLLGKTESLPLTCQLSSAFVAHLKGTALLANEALLTTLAGAEKAIGGQALREQLGKSTPMPGALHALAVARGQWNRRSGGASLRRLNLISHHTFPHQAPDGAVGVAAAFDIVANEMAPNRGTSAEHFLARVEQGVLDSNAEAILIGSTYGNATADLFEASSSTSRWVPVRTVRDLDQLAPPPDVRVRLEADVRSGFVLLAPVGIGTGDVPTSWWRVDPKTGDTLAFGNRGWGQAHAEYVAASYLLGFGFCFAAELATANVKSGHIRLNASWPGCFGAGGVTAGSTIMAYVSPLGGLLIMVLGAAIFVAALLGLGG